jgi:hypothetical protein
VARRRNGEVLGEPFDHSEDQRVQEIHGSGP